MVVGSLEAVAEEGGGGGGAGRRHLLMLRERNRGQARLLLSAKRRIRAQSDLVGQLHNERDSNLRSINSQLLLFESNLRRRQEELSTLLREKDLTIRNQQRLILALASAYTQITGHTEILKVLTSTTKEDPNVDLPKILRQILARVSPTLEAARQNSDSRNNSSNNINSLKNDSNCGREKVLSSNDEREGSDKRKNLLNDSKNEISGCNVERRVDIKSQSDLNGNSVNENDSRTIPRDGHGGGMDKIQEETTLLLDNDSLSSSERKQDSESIVTDADSAIMLEDTCSDSLVILPCMRDGVKVIRSVSDALECASRPLQLPPPYISPVDSASTTPVNSPSLQPRSTATASSRRGCLYPGSRGSLSSTPSCSSSEDSDASPTATLNKARSSSIETIHDINEGSEMAQEPHRTEQTLALSRSRSQSSEILSSDEYSESFLSGCKSAQVISSENRRVEMFEDCPVGTPTVLSRSISEDPESLSSVPSLTLSSHLEDDDLGCLDNDDDSDSTLSEETSDVDIHEHDGDLSNDLEEQVELSLEGNFQETCIPDRRLLLGSYEKLDEAGTARPCSSTYRKKPDELIQVTYNRVMSNHRSVTKVKDVKYRRINKAKSRSLEELRGKLRIHEGKPLITVSIGHSYA